MIVLLGQNKQIKGKIKMLKPLLSKIDFSGWGIKFKLQDLDWKTIAGLALILAAIVYVIKG